MSYYVSKPPLPEAREANRLHAEAVKKRKDAAKETAARKWERKDKHDKACARERLEGLPLPPTPKSTEEEDSSTGGVDFSESDDFKAVTGVSPPPDQRGAGGEASTMALGERRLVPATLVVAPAARAERRSPMPAAGQRSPAPAAGRDSPAPAATGRRSPVPAAGQRLPSPATGRQTPAPATSTGGGASAASAETPVQTAPRLQVDPRATPSGQSSGGVSVPRARRSGMGKRSLSSLSE